VKREPESDRGGYPLPQPPLISARSEHQNYLAEPAYTLPGASWRKMRCVAAGM